MPGYLKVAILTASVGLIALGAMVSAGCQPRADVAAADPWSDVQFNVEATRRDLLAGETITILARDRNTVGRDVQVEWFTTGGELTTEQGGRIARVRFDQPGEYRVTGRLYVDDMVFTDSTQITVKPVR